MQTAWTTIALVRHGQTDWNATGRFQGSSDTELNDVGRAQAVEAADWLAAECGDLQWSVVRHSPLQRAAVTGQLIADALGIAEGKSLPSLTERDWALAEALTLAECVERWPEMHQLDTHAARELIPGVEPVELVTARGVHAISTITTQHAGRAVVVTSHGTLLRFALSSVLDTAFGYVPNGGVVVLRTRHSDGLQVELLARSFDDADGEPTQSGPRG